MWMVLPGLVAQRVRDLINPARDPEDQPPEPPESRDPHTVSTWLHRVLTDAYAYEREAWALERIARVECRLQAGVPESQRLKVELLWIPEVTAFTFPGRYVYLSRRLLERVGEDEPIAFVVAHEMAHHALGHMRGKERWMGRLAALPGGDTMALLALEAADWFVHPEHECDADEYALRLCADAGYDLRACVRVMDVLQMDALDRGNLATVCGPEPSQREIDGAPGVADRVRRWVWERERGYPSLLARKERLRALAAELSRTTTTG
ncbi:MAG TPA: M48 family metalloprotease [Longimicrobium sp.]|nr:M48 family metalloprotease [Longimicrobium sp.]